MTTAVQNTSEPVYMTIRALCERLEVTDETAYKLVARGEFPGAIKLGPSQGSPLRIPIADVVSFEARCRVVT